MVTATSLTMSLAQAVTPAAVEKASVHVAADDGDIPDDEGGGILQPRSTLGQNARAGQCRTAFLLHVGDLPLKREAARTFEATLTEAQWRTAFDGVGNPQPMWNSPLEAAWSQGRGANFPEADRYPRQNAWSEKLKSYKLGYDDYQVPEFDPEIQKFLRGEQYNPFNVEIVPRASQTSVDRVAEIAAPLYKEEEYWDPDRWYAGKSVWSPDDLRRYMQYGGIPEKPLAKDSLEYRTDVEALKNRWAACDYLGPDDPYHVLRELTGTAYREWQAEQAGQAVQRNQIVAAEIEAHRQMRIAADAMAESMGQAWVADKLLTWQRTEQAKPAGSRAPASEFARASADITAARQGARSAATRANQAAIAAQAQADKVTAAQAAAGRISDAAGLPRGRGLLYAQQSAQVAKASAPAAVAAAKAADTAASASDATGATSAALFERAKAESAAVQAEYRRKAAEEAAAQAKASADVAVAQAAQAKDAAGRAATARATAEQAEARAKTAADDAQAKRVTAETERGNAAIARTRSETERARAQAADARAQSQRENAQTELGKAQTAGQTAAARRADAEGAEQRAAQARDGA
ncbi:hypothetical protein ABZS54_37715, partial [Embleya sp. NPDC005575]